MKLVIVESPAKAGTIKKFLGKDYTVVASKGHIRDLTPYRLSVEIKDGKFIPKYYEKTDTHKQTIKQIKELAKQADEVYIATDEDREGEAIGWHLSHIIKKDPSELPRITFHEITKTAILNAIQNPRKIDMDLVNAQQARRVLDRLVGYKLSPLLARKLMKGLSAGRVQSAALKIVVDREKEIQKFIPKEYWTIEGIFKSTRSVLTKLLGKKVEKFTITSKDDAERVSERLKSQIYEVYRVETKLTAGKSIPPFKTSTLQQTASSMLGFNPTKTMKIAQKLYEGVRTPKGTMGIITYMRTDSLNIAKEAKEAAAEFIRSNFGEEYLEPKDYENKTKGAQEAHEAIRPTKLELTPESMKKYLENDEWKLYNLIYTRFIASQMKPPKFNVTNVYLKSDKDDEFKITGKQLVFEGYYKIYSKPKDDEIIPEFKEHEELKPDDVIPKQNFTKPPERYSEASLIKKLEELGIGRPSTYAPTIQLLKNRKYITTEKKAIKATDLGIKVVEFLDKHFPEITNPEFTANMESKLDEIAVGKEDWQRVLGEFYFPLESKIKEGYEKIPSEKKVESVGRNCPKCGAPLVKRTGRYGEFVACSAYPKCKYVEKQEKQAEYSEEKCDKCGGRMVIKTGKRGKFLACENYPKCKNTKSLLARNDNGNS